MRGQSPTGLVIGSRLGALPIVPWLMFSAGCGHHAPWTILFGLPSALPVAEETVEATDDYYEVSFRSLMLCVKSQVSRRLPWSTYDGIRTAARGCRSLPGHRQSNLGGDVGE
jgi:hypothetical protein